jgi:hypothetical protein
MVTDAQIKFMKDNGYLLLEKFYDYHTEIEPIQVGIWKILSLLIIKYKLPISPKPFSSDNFDHGYKELIQLDRKLGGEVYDAIKQIPAFMRLVSNKKNEDLFNALRGTANSGISAAGYGIRIDNPNEEKYRSLWHYEYRDQFRSTDGMVFWSPLVPVLADMGPVQLCPKSHLGGLRRSYMNDLENPEKTGAYALRIENEAELIKEYGVVQPLSNPGDLMLMDFLTLHSSGKNVSSHSRWSMQFRYFNFDHPSGVNIGWRGVSNNLKLEEVHPELVVKR